MSLTDKQLEFLENCNHRWNVKTGATRSGKTFLDCAYVIPKRIMACRDEGLIVMLGNTMGTLERNVLEPMRSIWGGQLVGVIRTSQAGSFVELFGKKVYVLGADNKKHIARIQGAAFEYAYGDEITTWNEGVFQMLKSRLSCQHSHFDGTCNPDNPNHWFRKFIESDADVYCQPYTIDDNPTLPPAFVTALKQEYQGTVYYQRFILGRWVAAEGAVYPLFADEPKRFIIEKEPPIQTAIIGVDFGGNGSADAFVCVGLTQGMQDIIVLDEWHKKAKKTPQELEKHFVEFVRCCTERWRVSVVYCDSAEQTLIQGLKYAAVQHRLGVPVDNALKGEINQRIRFYNRMIGADRFRIMNRCKSTIEAISTAVWSSKSLTQDVRLDDGTTNIDSLDAMEYTTERLMPAIIAATSGRR